MYRLLIGTLILAQQTSTQCSGSGGSVQMPMLANTVQFAVNAGPTGDSANVAFTTVTICVAGQTSACQTIDGVSIDTGSSGLRLLSSVVTLPLALQTTGGATVTECFPFQDGFTWGPVARADVKLGTMQASNVPIQLIGGAGVPAPPDSCTNSGMPPENTLDALGSNGVLGIGLFRQDCGSACSFVGASNPGLYYACNSSSCQVTPASLAQQVANPVWLFPSDNNGVVLMMPSVTATGQASTTGVLVFGIGTESNNGLGSATVFALDPYGAFTTRYGTTSVSGFLDSGSNGLYFLDSTTAQLPLCAQSSDFYCPPSPQNLSATNVGANGRSGAVPFTIGNAAALFRLPDSVLPQLGGPFADTFDWGLPFFYGRAVFTAIEGQSTPAGVGPYFAY